MGAARWGISHREVQLRRQAGIRWSDCYEESWELRATDRNWATIAEVERVAQRHGADVAQVALAWLLRRPSVASVIIGARTLDQFESNLGALDVRLDDADMDALDSVSEPASMYPYRMVDSRER